LVSEALFAHATHGIPRSGFKEATKDYQKILLDIQAFTNVQEPMFFAKVYIRVAFCLENESENIAALVLAALHDFLDLYTNARLVPTACLLVVLQTFFLLKLVFSCVVRI
jgi:hypothetical protein